MFTPTDAQQAAGLESGFAERSGTNWGGVGMSAEAIGIPIDSAEPEPAEEPLLPQAAESTEGPYAEDENLEVFEVGGSSPRLVAVESESDLGLVDDEQTGFHDDAALAAGTDPQHLHPRRTVHPTDSGSAASPVSTPRAAKDTDPEAEDAVANFEAAIGSENLESENLELEESEFGSEPTVFLDEGVQEDELAEPGTAAVSGATDDWAPVEVNPDPLAAGVEVAAAAQALAEGESQDEFAAESAAEPETGTAGEEAFVEADARPALVLVGGEDRPQRRGGMLAAAALLLVGGGGFFAYQRGWLTQSEPQAPIVRAEVPRPDGFQAPLPPLGNPTPASQPASTQKDPLQKDPLQKDPNVPTDSGKGEELPPPQSQPTRDPQPSDPNPEIGKVPDLKGTDPVATDPLPPVAVTTKDPKSDPADPARELGTVQIGEGLTMREAPKEPVVAGAKQALRGILPGSQAFAQLNNGNFFVGNVKAVDADFVTLRLEKGEVTLAVAQLKTIVPLASSEYQQLKKVDQGFVRLNNRNRLLGTILATKDENIILENKANRIVIPKSAIEELGTVGRTSVRLADEDNSWVDRVIEKQLQDRDPKPDAGSPVQSGKGRKDKPKVKSVVGEDTGARPK